MNFQFFEEHDIDSAFVNNQQQEQFLNIPVCASTWGKRVFGKADFQIGTRVNEYKTILFFRDPIDRWLSGLSTWLTLRLPQHTGILDVRGNKALLDVLFDSVRQDDHTEKQCFFVQNVDWKNTVCFYINDSFESSVNQFFVKNYSIDISNVPRANQTTLEGGKLIPRNYFQTVLESNQTYQNRLKEFFEIDYKLIQSLNFENAESVKCKYYDF